MSIGQLFTGAHLRYSIPLPIELNNYLSEISRKKK